MAGNRQRLGKTRGTLRVRKPKIDRFKFYDIVIYAARGSTGARRLATALGARRWRDDLPERYTRRRPYFRGNRSPMVVNWGSTVHPGWLEDSRFRLEPVWVNRAEAVGRAINKLDFFKSLGGVEGIPLLKWTESKEEAAAWLEKKSCAGVVCRKTLRGSSGEGIVLAKSAESLVSAPLYTRMYPKTHEFRVHVFGDKVIDLTQKKFKGDVNVDHNRFVRSHDNGWVHAHSEISLVAVDGGRVGAACISAVHSLGLQFGAVDVLAVLDEPDAAGVRKLKSFVICEVNTGPGLENQVTIDAYAKAILELKNVR